MAYGTGKIDGYAINADGAPTTKFVKIFPSVIVKDEDGNTAVTKEHIRADVNQETGYWISRDLPATDDLSLDPSGVTYEVHVRGFPPVTGVDVFTGQTRHWAAVMPVDPEAPQYALQVSHQDFLDFIASVSELLEDIEAPANPLIEDPGDPGFYIILSAEIVEDPADPGFYLIGA